MSQSFIHLSVQIEAIDFAIAAIQKDAARSSLPMAKREAKLRVEYLHALKRTMEAIAPHREAVLALIAKENAKATDSDGGSK